MRRFIRRITPTRVLIVVNAVLGRSIIYRVKVVGGTVFLTDGLSAENVFVS